jgi:hypothetical protein
LGQPSRQGLFGATNGGPNGPQSVVQIKGDGFYFEKIDHGERE